MRSLFRGCWRQGERSNVEFFKAIVPVSDLPYNMNRQEQALETERLLLEPLVTNHASEMYYLLQDIAIYRFIPTKPPKSIDELTKRYEKLQSRHSPDNLEIWLNWVLRKKADNSVIGRLEATIYQNETADIAYEIASKFWGQGFAFESCFALVNNLCDSYGLKVISAKVDTRNINSIKLLKKLKFEIIDEITEADFFNGQPSDEYVLEFRCVSQGLI